VCTIVIKEEVSMGISIFFNVLAIFVLFLSMVFLMIIRKWSAREIKRIDKKKNEIEEMLLSADQMIDELNRFSDYMIGHIEEKVQEAENLISQIDNKIDNRQMAIQAQSFSTKIIQEKLQISPNQAEKASAKTIIPFTNKSSAVNLGKMQMYTRAGITGGRPSDNLLTSNLKTKQILSLSEKGFDEAEIAKMLNIGRGEIQLILGMRNGTTS
jgi:hypothetical protein